MTPRAVGPEASGSSVSRRGFLRACAFALAGGAWPARADEKSPAGSARERWKKLSPKQREKVRERYEKFGKLPPKEQARVRKNLERWQKLSPDQRKAARESYKRWRDLPPEKRDQLRERWRELTPEQRKELRKRRGQRKAEPS